MPVEESVRTLASSFEGIGGALALSVIAFSVVFLVLAGLTLVIFAMRYVTRFASKAGTAKTAAAPVKAKTAAPAAAPVAAPAAADDELIAVIAAAIAAQSGAAVAIKNIVPAGTHLIGEGVDGWIACGRIEALQGALSDRWN